MPKPKNRHSKAKIALIPVLLCVLVAVLYEPDAGPSDATEPAAGMQNPPPAAPAPVSEADLQRVLTTLKKRQQPVMDYEDVVSYDPFQNLPLLRSLTAPKIAPPSIIIAAEDSDAVEAVRPSEFAPQEIPESRTYDEIKTLLQSRNVSAILQGMSENAAIIDARIVHVGDLLEPGLRIVDIKPSGIMVQIEPE
ncbi:MAG: hypothetical protein WD065_09765 [Planctomycetaceae bacterium]